MKSAECTWRTHKMPWNRYRSHIKPLCLLEYVLIHEWMLTSTTAYIERTRAYAITMANSTYSCYQQYVLNGTVYLLNIIISFKQSGKREREKERECISKSYTVRMNNSTANKMCANEGINVNDIKEDVCMTRSILRCLSKCKCKIERRKTTRASFTILQDTANRNCDKQQHVKGQEK